MKTIGLMLLFGLCVSVGMHIASAKCARLHRINELIHNLHTLSDLIGSGQNSLVRISQEQDGELFRLLRHYLALRSESYTEANAAQTAVQNSECRTEEQPMYTFLCGLSSATSAAIMQRIDTLLNALDEAQKEAAETAKQAKTIRAVGVLIGAGICILLL